MTRYVFAFFVAAALASSCLGNDIFIAQNAAGTGNGTSCANAAIATFFNTSSNWGTGVGQIGPGTTVHLCGTITTNLTFQGSGSAGGASLCGYTAPPTDAQAACTPVVLDGAGATMNAFIDNGKSYWIIQNVTWAFHFATNLSNQAVIQTTGGATFGTIQNNHIDSINCAQAIFFGGQTSNIAVLNNFLRNASGTGGSYPAYTGGDGFDTDVIDTEGGNNVLVQGNYMELNVGASDANTFHDDITQTWNSKGTTFGWVYRYNEFVQNSPTTTNNLSWCIIENMTNPVLYVANVFYGPAGGNQGNGCSAGGAGETNQFYYNTMIAANGTNGALNNDVDCGNGSTCDFRGNVAMNLGSSTLVKTTFPQTEDYNFFGASSGSFPCNAHDICTTTPTTAIFNNYTAGDYSPSANSVLKGAGINLGALYNTALAPGATWPNPTLVTRPSSGLWDVGAYQSQTSLITKAPWIFARKEYK